MRHFNLESFGNSFGILTLKFLESGKPEHEIECESRGQAINIRLRMNQYWKVLRQIPPSQVPPAIVPWLDQIPQLTCKNPKDRPCIVILTTKDTRILDTVLLRSADKVEQTPKGLSATQALLDAAAERAAKPSSEEVLKLAYGLDEAPTKAVTTSSSDTKETEK